MTADFEKLARTVLQLTEAVGIKEMSAKDALDRLESCIIAECCDLRGIRSIWKVICMSTEVLAILVPEKKEIFLLRGDGPEGPVDIPPEVLAKIMINEIMNGIVKYFAGQSQSAGASALLAICPNPVPKPNAPFSDSQKLAWDDTQRRFVRR